MYVHWINGICCCCRFGFEFDYTNRLQHKLKPFLHAKTENIRMSHRRQQ